MLSLRSQTKPTLKFYHMLHMKASLVKGTQPDSKEKTDETKLTFQNSH
jgi:hypothetical protein